MAYKQKDKPFLTCLSHSKMKLLLHHHLTMLHAGSSNYFDQVNAEANPVCSSGTAQNAMLIR